MSAGIIRNLTEKGEIESQEFLVLEASLMGESQKDRKVRSQRKMLAIPCEHSCPRHHASCMLFEFNLTAKL